jgi:hypothetical protein
MGRPAAWRSRHRLYVGGRTDPEAEAEAVRAIFAAFAAGSSLKAIAAAPDGARQAVLIECERPMIQRLPSGVTRDAHSEWAPAEPEHCDDSAKPPLCGMVHARWEDRARRRRSPGCRAMAPDCVGHAVVGGSAAPRRSGAQVQPQRDGPQTPRFRAIPLRCLRTAGGRRTAPATAVPDT